MKCPFCANEDTQVNDGLILRSKINSRIDAREGGYLRNKNKGLQL